MHRAPPLHFNQMLSCMRGARATKATRFLNLLHTRDRHFYTPFRIIPLIACQADDLVGHPDALRHFAKHGVLAVQESRVLDDDEELEPAVSGSAAQL